MTMHNRKFKIGLLCRVLTLFFILLICAPATNWPVSADTVQYIYDSLNRLIEVRYPDKVIRYTYDAAGNRTSEQVLAINPVPALAILNPGNAVVGSAGFTLTVNGTNFVNGATVRWNGADRPTTFVDSTRLMATITAPDIGTAGSASITVINPDPTGGASSPLNFSINNPVPAITNTAPASIQSGSAGFILTVNGTNFVNGAVAKWNGSNRATSVVSNTQLTMVIADGDLASPGTASITVVNPTPGGGASNTASFTISPCGGALSPASLSFSTSAATGSISVITTTGSCAWTAASNASWIAVSSGSSGVGNGAVSYSIAANPGPPRTGTITIAGNTFTAMQASGCTPFSTNPATLTGGTTGTPYPLTLLSATGGVAPHTFNVTAGSLPPGLTLSQGGALSGTPTASGSFNFTIRATDSNGCFGERTYTLIINPCADIVVNPELLPSGTTGIQYSHSLTASGGEEPYSFSVNAGALPTGLSLASSTGILSGTPVTAGTFDFTVKATDANGCSGERAYTVQIEGVSIAGLQYYPLPSPVRLLDTRQSQTACFTPNAPLGDNAVRLQEATGTCAGIPASAKAIVGNATVVNFTSTGFHWITLYPSDAAQPNASNLNFSDNQIVPNAFTVGLGADGAFNIYSHAATDFIVDITGYYAPPGQGGLYFHPLPAPVRLFDSRPGETACDAPGSPLANDGTRTVLAHQTCLGATIPSSAKAIVGNATVVNFISSGFHWITLYPLGTSQPNASNLNFTANQIVPNAFVVGLSNDGKFNIYSHASTHFIVDVVGYFSDEQVDVNGQGLLYNPLPTPVRLLDTRPGESACDAPAAPLGNDAVRTETAHGTCFGATIPSSAKAVVGNGTVVNFISSGFHWITLYPFGASPPNASNLNFTLNQIVPNAFVVGLSSDGKFNIYSHASTEFIVDLTGYFAP